MPKFYPEPPRNPALDQFRGRQWSESALFPAAPRRKPVRFVPSGKVFVIRREPRHFAVVAATLAEAEQRINALYP
jgi:hypothetical protein